MQSPISKTRATHKKRKYYLYNNELLTLTELASLADIDRRTMRDRLKTMTPEQAVRMGRARRKASSLLF